MIRTNLSASRRGVSVRSLTRRIPLILAASWIALMSGSVEGATDITERTISTNTAWSDITESPYHVLGNVTVTNGAKLTIGSGVMVNIDSGISITAQGGSVEIQNSTVSGGDP
jgi:hypothetical protein